MRSPGLHARFIQQPLNQLLEWRSKLRLMLLKPPEDPPEVLFAKLTHLTPQERQEPMAGVMRLGIRQTSPTEENHLDLDPTSLSLGSNNVSSKVTVTSVGVRDTSPKTAEPLHT